MFGILGPLGILEHKVCVEANLSSGMSKIVACLSSHSGKSPEVQAHYLQIIRTGKDVREGVFLQSGIDKMIEFVFPSRVSSSEAQRLFEAGVLQEHVLTTKRPLLTIVTDNPLNFPNRGLSGNYHLYNADACKDATICSDGDPKRFNYYAEYLAEAGFRIKPMGFG